MATSKESSHKEKYGGGTVMLWDNGTWEPIGDPNDGYRRGRLKFKLNGEKLQGGWNLVKSSRSRSGIGQRVVPFQGERRIGPS